MDHEKVIVIDFGGQYNQLVARRVRECNVYCEIYSYKTDIAQIKAMNPKGIILTGGPNSCYEADSPTCSKELFELGVPVLGLCYGAQLMMHVLGGKVEKAPVREYGKTEVMVDTSSPLFTGVSENTICWMSHFDYISKAAPGFNIVAHTADCPVAAAENQEKGLFAIQFHPEVLHTQEGTKMLHNFVRGICGCEGTWRMDSFVENTVKEIREKVGNGKVLLALSGGVDSSVAAGLLSRAIGKQLTCVFVDHGLLRKNEGDEVEEVFGPNGQFDLNFIRVNAQDRYYGKLAGVTEPEHKRKIIGEEFIRVFEEEAKKIGAVDFLAQGTIYPDVVESGLGGESAVIKSHHNVGGLPDFVDFKEIIDFFDILISHTGARIPRIARPEGIFIQAKCLCLPVPEHQRTDPSVSQRKCLLPDSCRRLKYHFHTLFPVFQLLIFLLPATFFISRFYLISHCLSGYFSLSFVIVQSLHSCKPIRLVKYCLLNNYYCSIFHTIAIGVSPSRYSWGITTCIPSSVIFHAASFFVSTMEIPRIFS